MLSSAGTAASTKVGLRAGRLSELVVWATPLVPIVLGLRLVWYTLPERPGQCTLRAIESAPSQSWPIWPLAGHIRSWRCGICTFEKLPLNRPLRAESPRVPPKEKSGRVPSEVGPQAAWQSGPSLCQQRPAHVQVLQVGARGWDTGRAPGSESRLAQTSHHCGKAVGDSH